jgi:N-acetyl-alpha-D-muramate 1-phosphate uridylyltransferase
VKLPVAILVGGLATRLRPITESIPKAIVDVAGKPFIIRQLEYLRRQGVKRAVLCTGYLGEQIQSVVGDGAEIGIKVQYSQDWPTLMGTGGALKQALPLLEPEFMILYGDSYLPIDFAAVEDRFMKSGNAALMTVLRNEDRGDKSNVLFRDGRIIEYNKKLPRPEMEYIDYGVGAMRSEVLAEQPAGPFDLADVYHRLSTTGQLAAHEVHERFYEIGSPQGLAETIEYFQGEGIHELR